MERSMRVEQLGAGLWRWTVPRSPRTEPGGRAGGGRRPVGSVYYEPRGGGVIVLIDPQLPPADGPDADRFWRALDRDVERTGRPVAILVGNARHARSADAVAVRYAVRFGSTVHVPAGTEGRVACRATGAFAPGDVLPGDVVACGAEGLADPESAFFLPEPRALVVADALTGTGDGRVRLASRAGAADGTGAVVRDGAAFRASVRRWLELRPALLIPSHGEPVIRDATGALARALEADDRGDRG